MRSPNSKQRGWALAAAAFLALSCKQQGTPVTTIRGQMPGYEKQTIRLLQLTPQQRERLLLDSAIIDPNGNFSFSPIPLDSNLVQLEVRNGPSWLLFTDGKNIETSLLKSETEPGYSVSGSAGSAWILNAYQRLAWQEKQLEASRKQRLDFSSQNYPDSLQNLANNRYRRDSSTMVFLYDSLLRKAPNLLLYRYTEARTGLEIPQLLRDSLNAWAARRFADSTFLK